MAGHDADRDPNVAPDYAKFFEPMPLHVIAFWLQAVFNDAQTQRNVFTIMADWWNAHTDEEREAAAKRCADEFYTEEAYAKWAEGAGRRIVSREGGPGGPGGGKLLLPGRDF